MNREQPPKQVYRNNRLKKNAFPANKTSRPSHQNLARTSSNQIKFNHSRDDAQEHSFHLVNKTYSKYQKHFEPHSPSHLDHNKNKSIGVNKHLGMLMGIPLHHTYVKRKQRYSTPELMDKKSRETIAVESLPVQQRVNCQDSEVSYQHSTEQLLEERIHGSAEKEFFHGVAAVLATTFDEVVKDCPEILAAASKEKETVLKKLRFYAQRQRAMSAEEDLSGGKAVKIEKRNQRTISTDDVSSQVLFPGQENDSYRVVPCDPISMSHFSHPRDLSHHSATAIGENHLKHYKTSSCYETTTNNYVTKMSSSTLLPHRFKTSSSSPKKFLPVLRQNSESNTNVCSGNITEGGQFGWNPCLSGQSSRVMQTSSEASSLRMERDISIKKQRSSYPESHFSENQVESSGRLPLFDGERVRYFSRFSNPSVCHRQDNSSSFN